MKKCVLFVAAACVLLLALSSCGKIKDIKTSVSEQPSASVEASAARPSPDIKPTPEVIAEPTQTPAETESPSPSAEATAQPTAPADPTDDEPGPPKNEEDDVTSGPEFSFKAGDVTLTLRERDIDAKLKKLPFNLVSDDIEVLGEGSDTFTGSFVRTIAYDGLEIIMFAPKDNGDNFWILQIAATGDGIETERGVKVGDSVETLLQKYPDTVNSTDGGAENYVLTGSGEDDYAELVFIIENGTVAQITVTFYIP